MGHGSAARLMLDEYYVGEIDHVEVEPLYDISKNMAPKYNRNAKKQQTITKEEKGLGINFTLKFILLVVSTTILGVAIGFLLYKWSEKKMFFCVDDNNYMCLKVLFIGYKYVHS